jgi:hypothetical protein
MDGIDGMSAFGRELTRLMTERNVGVRQLARAVYCAAGHVSNLRSGKARPSDALAAGIDDYLQAGGVLVAAAREDRGRAQDPGPAPAGTTASGAVVALRAAMTGDSAGLEIASDGLAELRISRDADAAGVYSVPSADDPPYTATSLLLAGRHADAADLTRRIIDTAYRSLPAGGAPTNYARTLLILALAAAGLGNSDEAAATGAAALESGRVVWTTVVLAGKLARSLNQASPGSTHAREFRDRYIEARARLARPAQVPAADS